MKPCSFLLILALVFLPACQQSHNTGLNTLNTGISFYPERVPAMLHSNQYDLNAPDGSGTYPLQAAVFSMRSYRYYTNDEIVRDLLDRGAAPSLMPKNVQGEILSVLLTNGKYEPSLVVALLDHGLDPNAYRAARSPWFRINAHGTNRNDDDGYQQIADALIRNGIDLNATNDQGTSALHNAVSSAGHFKHDRSRAVAMSLIDAGADLAAQDQLDRTPLHVAIGANDLELVQALVDAGAPLDVPDNRGYTPAQLIQATKSLRDSVVLPNAERDRALRDGANPTRPDTISP